MRAALLVTSFLALGLAGCPVGDDDDDDSNVCGDLTRAQTYVEGVEADVISGDFRVALMAATPAPPNVDDNAWVIEVTDSAGDAATGCTCTVTPWMPDHGHGASVAPSCVESATVDGQYDIVMDFIMPGYWEVTVEMECGADVGENAFGFCAEG
ncbi:MAG: FixH family protein [Deltaproteobacteria bacterium]|nr:FixH family protein [Deltaproteobacteria bacterium]